MAPQTPRLLLILLALLATVLLVAWGAMADRMVFAMLLVVGLYGFVILWHWMVGAIWRPAIIVLVQVPFQGILGLYLGSLANLITWIPVAAFLVQIPRSEVVRTLFGSGTQRLVAIFIFALSFSYIIAVPHADLLDLLKDFGQKITLIFIVAALARAFLEKGFDRKCLLAISVSMTIMVTMALVEHYLGISIVGSAPAEWRHLGDYRLWGPGRSITINRMAFYQILPISLVLGILLSRQASLRPLTISVLLILGLGLVSTGSRGGMMGTLLALGLIWWLSRARVTSGLAIGLVILAGVVVASTLVPVEAFTRGEGTEALVNADDRLRAWDRAYGYFLRSPVLGVGWGQLKSRILQDSWYINESGAAAHNSLLELLSESGLVGAIPFVLLCWHVLRVLWRGARLDKETRGPLNVGLFAAFSGMLLATMTSNYQFERYFWVPIAFAASLELRGTLQPDDGAEGDRAPRRHAASASHQDDQRALAAHISLTAGGGDEMQIISGEVNG